MCQVMTLAPCKQIWVGNSFWEGTEEAQASPWGLEQHGGVGRCSSVSVWVAKPTPEGTSMGLGTTGTWDTTKGPKILLFVQEPADHLSLQDSDHPQSRMFLPGTLDWQELQCGPIATCLWCCESARSTSGGWSVGHGPLRALAALSALFKCFSEASSSYELIVSLVPGLALSWLTTNSLSS